MANEHTKIKRHLKALVIQQFHNTGSLNVPGVGHFPMVLYPLDGTSQFRLAVDGHVFTVKVT